MVIILGLGFTGQRLARQLLRGNAPVFAAVRDVVRFQDLADSGLTLSELQLNGSTEIGLPQRAVIVLLIPPLPGAENAALRRMIENLAPRRVIYISSTGVYGDRIEVDADTPARPADERGIRRLEEEQWVAAGSWSSLILRAAAIYGPGRGVHAAIRAGKMPRGVGSGVVSRIHVDDLAALIQAGIGSDLQGAWPVADDEPCSTIEIVAWCREFLRIGGMPQVGDDQAVAGRKVDGTRIREKLSVQLKYPSWRTGIPASLEEEGA